MIVEIEIKDIVIPQGLLPRVITGTVRERVEEYAEMLEQGVEFDPISVWKKGNEYWVIDGVHRISAHQKLGRKTIKAKLVECQDEKDFRIKAIESNLKHGLALTKEERVILATILYKEGVSEVEIQKIFGVSERTVERWLLQVKEEERQTKIKKALELKEQGWSQERIAEELGVDKSTISRWLSEVAKTTTCQKCNILDPQVGNITPEGYKALSSLIQKLGVVGVLSEGVCRELGYEGETVQDVIKAFRLLAETTKAHLRKLPPEADEELVRKWTASLQDIQKLSPEARRIWIERALEYWKRLRKEKEKEKLVISAAKKLLSLPEYVFSTWRSVRADLRYSRYSIQMTREERDAILSYTESAIDEMLRQHADELLQVYQQIPEADEEIVKGLLDIWEKELTYEEFVEDLHRRGYRVPDGLYRRYKELLAERHSEKREEEEDIDGWVKGWEEAVKEEEEKKEKEKQKKAKEEEEPNPILRDYKQYREQMLELAVWCARKHGVVRTLELIDEIRGLIEEEGKHGALQDYWKVW